MAKGRPKFQLYNTMSKQKEVFKPRIEGKVGMYVCGVTSYDLSHVGHGRAYIAFDVLYRYLKYLGYDVTYVRNFTDVDDKIIRRANEVGEDPKALSGRFCLEFLNDMADLHCLVPTHQPRVTDHMQQIKDMIAQIISNDCAYAIDGDVYFSVDNFPNYGLLSGRKLEDNRAGERVAVDERKRNPADFALWKAAKPGEPFWDSPWGPGRPGWHIECSAISAQYLTHTFDIHGGGMDLIFPHHENEIAQSCAASSESKVHYWVHNGFVTTNDEKMSKSLGNFFTIREVTKLYHPLALRHFLLGTHYRSPVNYSISQIEIASEAIFYLYQTLRDCENAILSLNEDTRKNVKTAGVDAAALVCINKLHTEFETKMSDDLQTSTILNSALHEALRYMNSKVNMLKKQQQNQQQLSIVKSLVDLEEKVKEVLDVLGLLSESSYTEVLQQLKDKALKRASLTEEDAAHSMEERMLMRKKCDQIRSDLAAKGIALMDIGGNETVWRPCLPVQQDSSLGNFFTIREVTKLYHPLALRHFLLGTHYRSPVNYSISQIEIASEAIFYLYQTLRDCENAVLSLNEDTRKNVETAGVDAAALVCINKLHTELESKMSDDLQTSTILNSALHEALRYMNSKVNMLKKQQQNQQQLSIVKSLVDLEEKVKEVLDVLGLLSESSYTEVLQQLKDKALKRATLTEEDVAHSIEEIMLLRKKCDQIRSDLAAKGIALMDIGGMETVWRPCVPVQQDS